MTNQIYSDQIGALAGGLCILHCVGTPILFVLGTCSEPCHTNIPYWWSGLDLLILIISFISVFYSTKNTTNSLLKPMFWLTWSAIAFCVLNEKFTWLELPEYFIYIPTMLIIAIHIYNLKFCQCQDEKKQCCVEGK